MGADAVLIICNVRLTPISAESSVPGLLASEAGPENRLWIQRANGLSFAEDSHPKLNERPDFAVLATSLSQPGARPLPAYDDSASAALHLEASR